MESSWRALLQRECQSAKAIGSSESNAKPFFSLSRETSSMANVSPIALEMGILTSSTRQERKEQAIPRAGSSEFL